MLKIRGNFCEFDEGDKRRFIEIQIYNYEVDELNRLKNIGCLEKSVLYSFLRLIDDQITDKTRFLFKLQTYIGKEGFDDPWDFNQNISDYEEFGFLSIESLLKFCYSRWGITKEDFKPIEETIIPK
ncbi:MAG: hypothetical protein GY714_02480 [Desulfobacterales bacterium]|nr:hypothetical protein [Desulfobacterales bacterium]